MLTIKSIFPKLSRDELFKYENCYLGVSLDNKYIQDPYFPIILQWINTHFKKCVVIIGDYLNRHNSYIAQGHLDAATINQNLEAGQTVAQYMQQYLLAQSQCEFEIIRWQDFLITNNDFVKTKNFYEESYKVNPDFAASLNQTAKKFVTSKNDKGLVKIPIAEALNVSIQYLLEEIAVFDLLEAQGFKVKIYPGTILPTLKDIVNKKILNLGSHFKDAVCVEISVRSALMSIMLTIFCYFFNKL